MRNFERWPNGAAATVWPTVSPRFRFWEPKSATKTLRWFEWNGMCMSPKKWQGASESVQRWKVNIQWFRSSYSWEPHLPQLFCMKVSAQAVVTTSWADWWFTTKVDIEKTYIIGTIVVIGTYLLEQLLFDYHCHYYYHYYYYCSCYHYYYDYYWNILEPSRLPCTK